MRGGRAARRRDRFPSAHPHRCRRRIGCAHDRVRSGEEHGDARRHVLHIVRVGREDVGLDNLVNGVVHDRPSAGAGTYKWSTTSARIKLAGDTAQVVERPVEPNYPPLARQMKVQGAVILQALISRDGKIQELQIVSGPDILAAAAREAVKQWHFRPFYQNGRPVESQARVTVNFTISTN